jgi:formamidopyrimidine-DNA glycosylase
VRRLATEFGPESDCALPELPEAETIARGLDRALRGEAIVRVQVFRRKNVVAPAGRSFARSLLGDRIERVGRRGKYVVIELQSRRRLIVQLRMTGRLLVLQRGERAPAAARLLIHFQNGSALCYADVRKLGRVTLAENGAWEAALGAEPLGKDFTVRGFAAMLSGRTTPIKVLLLDQRRLAGVGNIYACEALWAARIRPSRSSESLTASEVRRLHRAIVDVLQKAIALRGSSIDDYVDENGSQGGFQNVLRVYGRRGKPCVRCGSPIVRAVLATRGTWWCGVCQK